MSILMISVFAGAAVFPGILLGHRAGAPFRNGRFRTGVAFGFMLYLLLDLLGHARELPVEALDTARRGESTMSLALLLIGSLAGGLVLGWLAGIALMRITGRGPHERGHSMWLALLLAIGIGLYNFLQGMSMGEAGRHTVHSAVSESGAEVLLLLGFLLHNAAKGAVIVLPLAGSREPIPWRTLVVLGLVAALPIVPGAMLGIGYWNPYLFVSWLAFAAGVTGFVMRELRQTPFAPDDPSSFVRGNLAGFIAALIVTLALEISHYSLPELMSTYWL